MKRGLVIGKFMPLHKGHIALIEFAASHCDELIVSMSYTDGDPIDSTLRFSWIQKQFSAQPKIKPNIIKDDFDNDQLPLPERTAIWTDKMKSVYPPIDVLISSEEYGQPFAHNLDAVYLSFDPERKEIPVSATAIRTKPFTNWQYIPEVVRPYFVKKICLYGPESTGKSTLSKKLAQYYKTVYVPEAARDLLKDNHFGEAMISQIARTQHQYIQQKLPMATKLLFCDTDAITTEIYSSLYLNTVPQTVYQMQQFTQYDLYFLLDIDIPWVADPLRDQGHRRKELFNIFEAALIERNLPYHKISGSYFQRETKMISVIDALIGDL